MADYNEEEKQRNPMTFSIDEIGFSGRTNNCLRRHGVKTIGELCNMTESEVNKIRNLGFNSLLEIKTKLAEYGLNLAKLESNKEGRTPIDDAPISNEEKEKITEKQNALKMTMKSLDGKMDRLEQKIDDFKSTVNTIKESDCAKWVEESKVRVSENARNYTNIALQEMRAEARRLAGEIESRERKLETLDPTSKYYSAIVGGVLDAVKERGYELTNQNVTDIICKALDVASYQKWQEIKGENFGNNKLKVKTI